MHHAWREPAVMKFPSQDAISFFIFSTTRYYRGFPEVWWNNAERGDFNTEIGWWFMPKRIRVSGGKRWEKKRESVAIWVLPQKWKCSTRHDNCSRRVAFAELPSRRDRKRDRKPLTNHPANFVRLLGARKIQRTYHERRLKINFIK